MVAQFTVTIATYICDCFPILRCDLLSATPTQIAVVQISLWLSVIMIFVLSVVVYGLGGMNYQTDTLLFQKSKDM
jgi:hypothetical protein